MSEQLKPAILKEPRVKKELSAPLSGSRLALIRQSALGICQQQPNLLTLDDVAAVFNYTTMPNERRVWVEHVSLKPHVDFNGRNPYEMTPADLQGAFSEVNKLIYRIVDARLSNEPPFGKHSHDVSHIDRMNYQSFALIEQTDLPLDVKRKAENLSSLMIFGHDYGNMEDRKSHADFSTDYLVALAPDLQQDPASLAMIRRGIELHDSSELVSVGAPAFFDYWIKGDASGLSEFDKQLADDDAFRVAFCALYISDKTDFGIQRLNKRVMQGTTSDVFYDSHNRVDLRGENIGIALSGTKATWEIGYKDHGGNLSDLFKKWAAENTYEVSFQEWIHSFFTNYPTRSFADPFFALFPGKIDMFAIQFKDMSENTGQGFVSTRENRQLQPEVVPQQPLEIERKWVVDGAKIPSPITDNLSTFPHQELRQVYAKSGRMREVKKNGNVTYIQTNKTGKGVERIEIEKEIDQSVFDEAWKDASLPRVTKTRYKIPFDGYTIELDTFHDNGNNLDDHMVAEIEFKTRGAADEFAKGLENNEIVFNGVNMKKWLARDVSDVEGYGNSDFAKKGWPEEK